ncbi:MAG: hypothetical protein P4L36_10605 [Holophaga sp.]|nr:hypothetical protein [Holophaga sp.]
MSDLYRRKDRGITLDALVCEQMWWDQSVTFLPDLSDAQRRLLRQEYGPFAQEDPQVSEVLQVFCRFWGESIRRFGALSEVDRQTWLREARSGDWEVRRFADTLQAIHRRGVHVHSPIAMVS